MSNASSGDLAGRTCVVTGGGGVIGGALVNALAASGVKVAVLDLNADAAGERAGKAAKESGTACAGFQANVLERDSLERALRDVTSTLGPVDLLINCAGGNHPKATTKSEFVTDDAGGDLMSTFFGLDMEGFRKVFDLNFLGTVMPTMIFGRDMVKRKCGAVLNISSMNSFRPLTKIPAYSAAKASINNLTQWLAVHFAPANVRVNAIAPGFFLTEQNRFLLTDEKTGGLTARGGKILAHTPMGRFGEPADLGGAALFLLSDAARFVTGVVLPIDGGFSAYSGV